MDLATGNMKLFPKVEACTMTQMVVDRVKLMGKQQGYKCLKFFNRKKEEILLHPADLLAEVGGDVEVSANENTNFETFGNLPQEGDDSDISASSLLLGPPDELLDVDGQIDSSKLAELLEDK